MDFFFKISNNLPDTVRSHETRMCENRSNSHLCLPGFKRTRENTEREVYLISKSRHDIYRCSLPSAALLLSPTEDDALRQLESACGLKAKGGVWRDDSSDIKI